MANSLGIITSVYLAALICIALIVPASYAQNNSSASGTPAYENISKESNHNDAAKKYADDFQQALIEQEAKFEKKIESLSTIIQAQRDTITSLETELKVLNSKPVTNGTTFEVWSGIVLGASALMITILGVGVALLTFIGYKELIAKGTKRASLVAAKQTKLEVEKYVAEGKLDAVIAEIINKIMYRGISPGSDDDEVSEDVE
jgi:hypothetical protein